MRSSGKGPGWWSVILGRVDELSRYTGAIPRLREALAVLPASGWPSLSAGRRDLGPDGLYANVDFADGRGRAGARLEAHRRYIDVQITIHGDECIGWRPLDECVTADGVFDEGRDIGFFADAPRVWFPVPPGFFAVFFPEDAHAPLAGAGPLRKIILKLPVS